MYIFPVLMFLSACIFLKINLPRYTNLKVFNFPAAGVYLSRTSIHELTRSARLVLPTFDH